jgi:HEAT repeat protein
LAAQAASQFESHVENLRNFGDISAEWDELKQQSRRQPIDPRNKENLLDVRTILEAVAKIGPESSQEFYRKLAGESDYEVRLEAAQRLGEVSSDKIRNVPALRNLLADKQETVRMAAAASLLMLGEIDVRTPIMNWLKSPEKWRHVAIIRELARAKDGRLLMFARTAIEKVADEDRTGFGSAEFVEQLLKRIPK